MGGASLPAFFDASYAAMVKFGMNFHIANDLGPLLEEAGYTNLTLKTIKVPIGTWPKVRAGVYFAH